MEFPAVVLPSAIPSECYGRGVVSTAEVRLDSHLTIHLVISCDMVCRLITYAHCAIPCKRDPVGIVLREDINTFSGRGVGSGTFVKSDWAHDGSPQT
jgi:hypothetical protein